MELGADIRAVKSTDGGVTVWTINTEDPTADPVVPVTPSDKKPATPSASKSTKVKVVLPSVKILKPKSGKRKLTVRWKKISSKNRKKITGIEIQVARDKKFKKIVKKKTASKKKTSKTIKGLKKNKYYWVRIRTYKKTSGAKRFSAWSAKKRVKVK